MIDVRTLQEWLQAGGHYAGAIDGSFGPKSVAGAMKALDAMGVNGTGQWSADRIRIACAQAMLACLNFYSAPIDGYLGPDTELGIEKFQTYQRQIDAPSAVIAHQPTVFPRQRDCLAFYGAPGTGHVSITLPYAMKLAWDPTKKITSININAKCAESAKRALTKILNHYGTAKLSELGLDLYGGCYANRAMRGGTALSMHAYAAALDINPAANQLRWDHRTAAMAKPECAYFLDAFEAEGWISLGRERDFDWMHVQGARL